LSAVEHAADLHGTRCPVLALTRRQGTREHRSAVAALPILLIATRPSTDPSMLSMKPTTEDTPNSHARQNLLHGLGSLCEPLAQTPLVVPEQHAAQLGETLGRVIERPEDCLAVWDRQGEDLGLRSDTLVRLANGAGGGWHANLQGFRRYRLIGR
jgi:hypothetical protein